MNAFPSHRWLTSKEDQWRMNLNFFLQRSQNFCIETINTDILSDLWFHDLCFNRLVWFYSLNETFGSNTPLKKSSYRRVSLWPCGVLIFRDVDAIDETLSPNVLQGPPPTAFFRQGLPDFTSQTCPNDFLRCCRLHHHTLSKSKFSRKLKCKLSAKWMLKNKLTLKLITGHYSWPLR